MGLWMGRTHTGLFIQKIYNISQARVNDLAIILWQCNVYTIYTRYYLFHFIDSVTLHWDSPMSLFNPDRQIH